MRLAILAIVPLATILLTASTPPPTAAFACWSCNSCGGESHKMSSTGTADWEGGHSFCVGGAGCNGHPSCGGLEGLAPNSADVPRLMAQVESGDGDAAVQLV